MLLQCKSFLVVIQSPPCLHSCIHAQLPLLLAPPLEYAQFPAKLGLPAGAPVYVDGASSGGSLALRLPRLVKFSGIIGGGGAGCCFCECGIRRVGLPGCKAHAAFRCCRTLDSTRLPPPLLPMTATLAGVIGPPNLGMELQLLDQ